MALTYIKFFVDSLDAIEPLDDGERGRLFTALLQYARTGEITGLQGNERFLFPMFRAQLDRDAASYENVCEANRLNGAKGGRPRKNSAAISETQKSQDKDKEKDKEKGKEKGKEKDQYKEKKEKEYSSCGADRPAQRKYSTRNRSSPILQDSPEMTRQNLTRMDKFLLQLRQEAAEQEARRQEAAGSGEDYSGGFH